MQPMPGSAGSVSLELMHRAIMASTNGIMIVELVADEMRISFVNSAYEKITGYAADDVIGTHPGMLHRDDTDQTALIFLRRAIADQQPITVTLRNYRKDGTLFWNELTISPVKDDAGRITHFVGILNDVTAQKNAEQELLSWAMRLDAITSLSADGMVTFDEGGRLSFVNDAFRCFIGLYGNELKGIGMGAFDKLLAERCDRNHPYRSVAESFAVLAAAIGEDADSQERHKTEIRLRQPQARVLTCTIRRSNRGESLLYFSDITRQRQLDEMKSEFLATAAHELRTPITSILGYSELLLMKSYDAATSRDFLEIILRQARRVTEMVNELLDLARIEANRGMDFELAVHDLHGIVATVAATFADSGSRIAIEMGDQPVLVNVDSGKIQQVLTNLLSNALKFSPTESLVTVSVRHGNDQAPSVIGIAVTDRGIGMTPDQLVRMGERFFRADVSGNVPGTGLGVALSKEVIVLHGGSLETTSESGKGSCFTMWLPTAAPADTRRKE